MEHDIATSPYVVPFDGTFQVADAPTRPPPDTPPAADLKQELRDVVAEIADLQRRLYAHDHHAVLLVFQAMDAAGKDSTIRAVTTGVNPAGFQVFSFKAPSKNELDHDFLWRSAKRLPERGRIGVFNRSYYEEVLVVRVHPSFLAGQRLPGRPGTGDLGELWNERYASIQDHELHLARNGTVILKFWLNVSKAEQARRFIRRIDRPDKNWKFSSGDMAERERWDDYMAAFEDALNATSRPHAPWYAIPADDKPFMRLTVARLVRDRLTALDLGYPRLADDELQELDLHRATLRAELGDSETPSA